MLTGDWIDNVFSYNQLPYELSLLFNMKLNLDYQIFLFLRIKLIL